MRSAGWIARGSCSATPGEMFRVDYVWALLGLALLVAGGEALVRGALRLSVRLALSPALIGVVVMGFGTSTPELAASLTAALADAPGIALGNVIGSNVANIGLILGLTALASPIVARIGGLDAVALGAVTLALLVVLAVGGIGVALAVIFLLVLTAYLAASLLFAGAGPDAPEGGETGSLWGGIGFVLVGLAMLIGGAQALIGGAMGIAESFNVPPSIIGLTLVAVGTSLPELAASLAAAFRGQGALALGNIVGSNIFNGFAILGITALVHPIAVVPSIGLAEAIALAGFAAGLLILGLVGRIGRWAGAVALAGYAAYVVAILG